MNDLLWAILILSLALVCMCLILIWIFHASLSGAGTASRQMRQENLNQCPSCGGLCLSAITVDNVRCPHCGICYNRSSLN